MKVIRLIAENVKRIKVVDITPKPGLNQVTGKNGNGKTSVLDSIWWAVAGEKNIQSVPLRNGAETGRIRVDLGDIVVERKFGKGEGLTVRNGTGRVEGAPDKKMPKYDSPQEVLDALIGRLSFDPLAFANKKRKEQYDDLKGIVKLDVDIDALKTANDDDFDARTELNRDAKKKRAQADGISIPADLPAAPIDETGLLNEMEEAADNNARIEQRKSNREQTQRDANDKKAEGVRLRNEAAREREHAQKRIAELQKQLAELEKESEERAALCDKSASKAMDAATVLEKKIDDAPALPAPVDISDLRTRLDSAKATNLHIANRVKREAIIAEAVTMESKAARLTDAIAAREQQVADAMATAKFPVDGLSFGDGGVLYGGLPFEQASDADRLRISCAIAMAGNPTLRVLRVKNGSLLDEDGIALLSELADANDYQIWLERVDSSGKIGIVMEDGEVKDTAEPGLFEEATA